MLMGANPQINTKALGRTPRLNHTSACGGFFFWSVELPATCRVYFSRLESSTKVEEKLFPGERSSRDFSKSRLKILLYEIYGRPVAALLWMCAPEKALLLLILACAFYGMRWFWKCRAVLRLKREWGVVNILSCAFVKTCSRFSFPSFRHLSNYKFSHSTRSSFTKHLTFRQEVCKAQRKLVAHKKGSKIWFYLTQAILIVKS